MALEPVPSATLTPAAERGTLTLLVWPLEDGTFQGAKHQGTRAQTDAGSLTYDPVSAPPTPRAGRAQLGTHLLCPHAGALPIVKIILQVAISYAKLELLQEGFVFHEIQCIEHVKPFLQGGREKQEQVKRGKSCLTLLPFSILSEPSHRWP